jgi:putative SOS response-associated peptidase YedK
MCGRFGRLSRFERIAQLTTMSIRNATGELQQTYNVAPGTLQPAMLNTSEGAVLRPLLWGLVPYWSKDPKKGARPVNARAESAGEKPMFRQLIERRRCLIPADWYYEWRRMEGAKVPFVFQMASHEPFFIGGLWDTWHYGKPDALSTFTVLTTEPNELAATVHDRMPLIVPPRNAPRWLDRSEQNVADLLCPYPAEEMTAYPVSPLVNSSNNDSPKLIEPLAFPPN